jgi:UDP-2,4-diacetamido-2,4,6-trideoxy-beta-L-altropyranose hydrolase
VDLVIRADAHDDLGTGHVIRCLTLAGALRERGANVRFVCRDLPGSVIPIVRARGFDCSVLARMPQPAANDADAADTLAALGGARPDAVVVDHYKLDARWERALRVATPRIMVLDDLADRDHDCDLLVDQNDWPGAATRYATRVRAQARQLLGTAFAILRPEFRAAREAQPRRFGDVRRLLVTFGGNDRMDMTMRTLHALDALALPGIAADIVVGAANPHRARIEAHCAGKPSLRVLVNTDRMAELMAQADLCIGAGGTSNWERCVLGLPALLIALADNQFDISAHLDRLGLVRYLGYAPEVSDAALRESIAAAVADRAWREQAGATGQTMVDGLGAIRVAEAIEHLLSAKP